jgi:3-methyl-2-oxobutanoate hydroxymethyltransferase
MTRTSKKVRVPDLVGMKERGERIVMLTAYDATMARLLDRAGIDLLLVGDNPRPRGGMALPHLLKNDCARR